MGSFSQCGHLAPCRRGGDSRAGETREEFDELKAFVSEIAFEHLGVFAYSLEENTASYSLPDQLDDETKQSRRDELMAVQQEVSASRLKRWVGHTVPVLVEGQSDESEFLWQGRHAGQAPDIDGHVLIRGGDVAKGKVVSVKIERAMEYDLIGIAV